MAQVPVRVVGANDFQIRLQGRWRISACPDPADAHPPFGGLLRPGMLQIVKAEAGMGVEHEIRLVFAREGDQQPRQQRMFENVGHVAGVELVAVGKHGADYSTVGAAAPAVQSFNFFGESR